MAFVSTPTRFTVGSVLPWVGIALAIAMFVAAFAVITTAPQWTLRLLLGTAVVIAVSLAVLGISRRRRALTQVSRVDGSHALYLNAGAAFVAHLQQVARDVVGHDGPTPGRGRTRLVTSSAGLQIVTGGEASATFPVSLVRSVVPFEAVVPRAAPLPPITMSGLEIAFQSLDHGTAALRLPVIDKSGRPFDLSALEDATTTLVKAAGLDGRSDTSP